MDVVTLAKQLLASRPLFLDTETTGLGPRDEIVEIAVIDSSGETLLDTLVKPTVRITQEAFLVHGISERDTASAPSFADVMPRLQAIIDNRAIAIYNAEYDVRMLEQSARAHGLSVGFSKAVKCAMHMYAEFFGEWNHSRGEYRWHKLEIAAKRCGIKISGNLHRARIDAEVTRQIVMSIAESDSRRL